MRVMILGIAVWLGVVCCAESFAMWPAGGPTPHEQKVYARKGHLTRRVRHNPAQTLWMLRYTDRDAIHYRRVSDYRALLDYPWHVRPSYVEVKDEPSEWIPTPESARE